MAKRFSITFRDFVFDTYLRDLNSNRSAFVEEHFVKGIEVATGEVDNYKVRYLELLKLNKDLEVQNQKLKLQIENYKKKFKDHELDEYFEKIDAYDEGMKRAGILRGGGR